jgi:glycosyltransferase involved in cell wall biosynthesis
MQFSVKSKLRNLRVLFLATRDWFNPATTGGDNTLWENARYLASVGHRVTYVASMYPGAASRERVHGMDVVRLGGVHSLWLRTFLYYTMHCRGKYDVVVAEGFGGSRIPRLTPLYVREPIITSWHQVHRELFIAQYPRGVAILLSGFERIAAWIHRNTWVQAYTKEWKEEFSRLGFRREKVFVLPVSIQAEWLQETRTGTNRNANILWIGKLRRYKCPHHAILAMQEVLKVVPRSRLTIVGRHDDLDYEESLRQLTRTLNVEKSVEFRFGVDEVEKRRIILESRALVLPSAVEGFGIVVLEANSCGVPVVASDRVPEGAVKDHVNGLRYPFGDIDALAQRLIELLRDSELHSSLAAGGRLFAQDFSVERIGAQFEAVVSRVAVMNLDGTTTHVGGRA